MRTPRALPGLAKATSDSDPHVRMAAVNALGSLGGEEAFEPVLRAWSDRNAEVRLAVVTQLKENESERATGVMVSALRDADAVVRAPRGAALEHRGWHPPEVEGRSLAVHRAGEVVASGGPGRGGDSSARRHPSG